MKLKELLKVIAKGELVDVFVENKRFVGHPFNLEMCLLDENALNKKVLIFYVNENIIYIVLE